MRLWLYGSQARGEAHAESDIDVLLVLRGANRPTREIDHITDILADFNLRYGVLLSVLPVTEDTLKREKPEKPERNQGQTTVYNHEIIESMVSDTIALAALDPLYAEVAGGNPVPASGLRSVVAQTRLSCFL